jgi:hypothetical protein
MKSIFKNNKDGGFIELIIIIIVILLIMSYFGITISGLIDWVMALFRNVFR